MSIDFGALMQQMGPALETIPVGDYDVVVKSADATTSSNNKPQVKVKFAVETGPHAGRTLYSNFTISQENPNALRIFFMQMEALGLGSQFFAASPSMEQVASSLLNKRARVNVGHRTWQGATQPDVKRIMPPLGGQTGAAPAGLGAFPVAAAPMAAPMAAPAPIPQPVAAAPAPVAAAPDPASPAQPAPQPVAPQPAAPAPQPAAPAPAPAPAPQPMVEQPQPQAQVPTVQQMIPPQQEAPTPPPPAPAPAPEAVQPQPVAAPVAAPAPAPVEAQQVAQPVAAPAPAPAPQVPLGQPVAAAPAAGATPPPVPF